MKNYTKIALIAVMAVSAQANAGILESAGNAVSNVAQGAANVVSNTAQGAANVVRNVTGTQPAQTAQGAVTTTPANPEGYVVRDTTIATNPSGSVVGIDQTTVAEVIEPSVQSGTVVTN